MKTYYKKLGLFRNRDIQKEIKQLDAYKNHCRIIHLLIAYEFPWDMVRSLELALFRTYISPSISKLLDRTGEFKNSGQKRYDDTNILIGEFLEKGYDSIRGRQAIIQMNKIHSNFKISNEDYLFVLTTFVLEPIDWINKYGWRKLTEKEKQALFYFWHEVGLRMKIKDIPETLEGLEEFSQDYINKRVCFHDANKNVANSTIHIVQGWLWHPFRFLVKPVINAMIDDNMRKAFGFKKPLFGLTSLIRITLKIRSLFTSFFIFGKYPKLFSNSKNRTYPNYPQNITLDEIGPNRFINKNKI